MKGGDGDSLDTSSSRAVSNRKAKRIANQETKKKRKGKEAKPNGLLGSFPIEGSLRIIIWPCVGEKENRIKKNNITKRKYFGRKFVIRIPRIIWRNWCFKRLLVDQQMFLHLGHPTCKIYQQTRCFEAQKFRKCPALIPMRAANKKPWKSVAPESKRSQKPRGIGYWKHL